MKKIRKLTGKKAKEYTKLLESKHVLIKINVFYLIIADIRLIFMQYMKFKIKYFHQRHRYPPEQRREIDLFVIAVYENGTDLQFNETGIIMDLRVKYLRHLYRDEFNQKIDWIRVTDSAKKDQIYVWHEDIDEYNSNLTR